MSNQIFQPNFTDVAKGDLIQGSWRYSLQACYRPSVDFQLPVICAAYEPLYREPGNQNLIQTAELDDTFDYFRAYHPCCPDVLSSNKTNIYTMAEQCSYIACFTSNETLAANFNQCVSDQADILQEEMTKAGILPENATRWSGGTGKCEYIDFKELKKGDQSGAQRGAMVSVQGVLLLAFAMLLAFGGSI